MHLSKIHIRNYRLFEDTELDVDKNMTLIVGRNNTAKTSLFECLKTVLNMKPISFYDYPLGKRKKLIKSFTDFVKNKKTFNDLCQSLELFSIEFYVDYFENENDDLLGELEPFIIDVDSSITTALICVKYELKQNEEYIRNLFREKNFSKKELVSQDDVLDVLKKKYVDLFEFNVFAVNPKNKDDKQLKTLNELKLLFPVYMISAERTLGEDENHNNSLSSLITSYFKLETSCLDPKLQSKIEELLQTIDNANKKVQKKSENILGELIEKSIGFGYPNIDELQLGVITKLEIDNEIKNSTELSYSNPKSKESLPNSYNGLGYKNLIKIEFLLAMIAKEMDSKGSVCIPLLLIEEPESHMHPQMQQTFANYLETFLGKITNKQIQTFITTHSAHIANNIDFSKIRYARKFKDNIIYKNLNTFMCSGENIDFIKKYLTLSRCDLFFADKIILIEGASERILLPDMIIKCANDGSFGGSAYNLSHQYYSINEVGGAYAYKFIPFMQFLELPCLILTDIDSVDNANKKSLVKDGVSTSNATLKWLYKQVHSHTNKVPLSDLRKFTSKDKTQKKCHIEFQVEEDGLCGRSLEESIINVNRDIFKLKAPVNEESIQFTSKSKTEFAFDLICNNTNYKIPKYIKDGLIWLNDQKVLD